MKFLLSIATLLLMLNCSDHRPAQRQESTPAIDTISYFYDGFNHHRKLDLLSNNTFIRFESMASCFGDVRTEKHLGRYTWKDSMLHLTPKTVELFVRSSFPQEIEYKDTLVYGADSLMIKTVFQHFEWKNKEYLLSKNEDSLVPLDLTNDYLQFAYYYNSGIEPEESGNYLTRVKEDTTVNIPWDPRRIPKEYRDNFLNEPISVIIVDREKEVEQDSLDPTYELINWRIKLNKGSDEGITRGLHFTTKDNRFFIDIEAVEPQVSYGRCYIYNMEEQFFRIGTEMRTKWQE